MTAADFPRTLVTRSMGTISVLEIMIVPTLRVVMHPVTLCVTCAY